MTALAGPVLAIDSSTRAAWVAVGEGERVLAEASVAAAAHASSSLLPAVDRAVRAAGLDPAKLGAVVVSGGPGSFTGLRIAAATAKGMVRALGVPLYAFSGLLAAAAAHREHGGPVCALFDARNREVYAGCWRFATDSSSMEEVLGVTALPIEEVLRRLRDENVLFAGDGAVLHADELAAAGAAVAREERSPARGLLWLARVAPGRGRVDDPAGWEPEYVRAAGVERIAAAQEAGA